MKNCVKFIFTITAVFISTYTLACDACSLKQPEVTKDLTHGLGPESDWDWFIVGIVISITIIAFIFSIMYLIRPGEKEKNHIKYSILQ